MCDAPITIPWDDIWVGEELARHNIFLNGDDRYKVNYPHMFELGPKPNNDSITSHLGFSPEPFNKDDMYLAHHIRGY